MSTRIGTTTVREAVAVFFDPGPLQAAIDELLSSGFDRAELSLVAGERTVEAKLGHAYKRVEELEDDPRVPRTVYVSTEAMGDAEGGLIGGLLYLGAVSEAGGVIASGGTIAGAIVAAVLAGGAGGFAGSALARLIDYHHADHLQEQLDHGGLLLWVRTRNHEHEHEERAKRILERHATQDVHVHNISATEFLRAHPRAGFLERALLDPTAVFETPEDVLAHPDFNDEQKVLILRRWEYEAREIETADDEGMRGESPDMLDRVLSALRAPAPGSKPPWRSLRPCLRPGPRSASPRSTGPASRGACAARRRPRAVRGRTGGSGRPLGQRQVDAVEHPGRAGRADQRPGVLSARSLRASTRAH